jgi:hypothetical protein
VRTQAAALRPGKADQPVPTPAVPNCRHCAGRPAGPGWHTPASVGTAIFVPVFRFRPGRKKKAKTTAVFDSRPLLKR